jgi:hypothetical protein
MTMAAMVTPEFGRVMQVGSMLDYEPQVGDRAVLLNTTCGVPVAGRWFHEHAWEPLTHRYAWAHGIVRIKALKAAK